MKPKYHLFRILSSLIVSGSFILAVINTDSWFWIGVECLAYQLLCYLIIAIDCANEIDDKYMKL